jgi:hypothetical protein
MANPKIEVWSTPSGEWVKQGIYLDMNHALRCLRVFKERNPECEYRINPDTVPDGWSHDQSCDE